MKENEHFLIKASRFVFQKETLLYLFLVLAFLIFRTQIEQAWSKYAFSIFELVFLKPTYLIEGWLSGQDVAVVVVGLLMTIHWAEKIHLKYLLSFHTMLYVLTLESLYLLFYREASISGFSRLEILSFPLSYLDLILVIYNIPFLYVSCYTIYIRFIKKGITSEGGFEVDGFPKEDLFGRKFKAEALAGKLLKTFPVEKSFAVGINAKWGEGKTVFMDYLRESIENKKNGAIIVEFNPWHSNSPAHLSNDFFSAFNGALKKYHSSLYDSLHEYADKIHAVNSGSKFLKHVKSTIDTLKPATFAEQRKQVNEKIKNLKRPIFVFIDDLDRLDKKEIIEVLKIIRNTADFSNTFFIVAYDKNYLIEAVSDLNPYRKEFYLEKIFQKEILLSIKEWVATRDLLFEKLVMTLGERYRNKINSYKELITDYSFHKNYLTHFIESVRDVDRFVNSFVSDYKAVEYEVSLGNFLMLHFIKVKYPDLFLALYEKKSLFFENEGSYFSEVKRAYKFNEGKFEEYFSDHDSEKVYYLNTEALTACKWVLTYVFGHINDEKSICFHRNFDIYFKLGLAEGQIQRSEFAKARSQGIKSLKSFILKQLESDSYFDLLYLMDETKDVNTPDEFECIIESIFYFGSKSNELKQESSLKGVKTQRLFERLSNKYTVDVIYGKDNNVYKNFVINLFNQLVDYNQWYISDFLANALIKLNEESIADQKFPLTVNELVNYSIKFFEVYLEKTDKIDMAIKTYLEDVFACQVKVFPEEKEKFKEPIQKFLSFVFDQKLIDEFIEFAIERDRNGKLTANGYLFPQIISFDLLNSNLQEWVKYPEVEKSVKRFIGIIESWEKDELRWEKIGNEIE